MARIFVNDVAEGLDSTPRTWGELLSALDQRLSAHGHVVTAARFDGVDQPSFRDPGVTAREVATVERIEIDSTSPINLVISCLGDATGAMERLCEGTVTLADLFRGHDLAAANRGLGELGENVRALVQLIDALRGPLGIDVDRLLWDGRPVPEHLAELATLVQSIITAQESHDWLTVADIIEYDMEPALRRWHAILLALRTVTERAQAS